MAAKLPEASEYVLPTFSEFLSGRVGAVTTAGSGAQVGRAAPTYAHPMDRAIIERLSRSTLQHPVNRFIELLVHYIFTPLLWNSIPVVSRSFPQLNALRAQAAETVGIPIPDMYAGQLPTVGQIFTMGTDEENFIFVETTFEHLATREEMLFVVGHECGHIHNQHVTYHVLAAVVLEGSTKAGLLARSPMLRAMAEALRLFIGPTLAAWSRRSEITADRAGLVCCRDLRVSQRALVRLVLGFAEETEVDIEDYIQTMRETPLPGATGRFALLETRHPIIPVRLQALQLFHDSEIYYEVTGLPPPDRPLMPRDELEGRVGELIAIL